MDITSAAGEIRWREVRAAGVDFVLIRVSRGQGGRILPDERLEDFLRGAAEAGISAGVYHTLGTDDPTQALAEAREFLTCITPYREQIRLWACCRAERETFREPDRAKNVLYTFLRRVQADGFSPMLGASPELLRILPDGGKCFPLWLLSWNVPEYRAMQFCPRIWQYDSGCVDGIGIRIPINRGYFGCRLPDERNLCIQGGTTHE